MKDNNIVQVGALAVIGLILIPFVINTSINVIGTVAAHVEYLGNRHAYNKKIKKGLKDGSITVINGQFYEIEMNTEEA